MKNLIPAAGLTVAMALSGCAGQAGNATYTANVAKVRAAYQITEVVVNAEIAAGKIPAAQAAIIKTAEADADPIVAALGATTSPTTIAAVLGDAQQLAAALPAGTITADVQQALLAAQVAYSAISAAK